MASIYTAFMCADIVDQGEEIISVGELNQQAKKLLENNFRGISVLGEISNIARPSSGHIYFTLKDEDGAVRCAMFRNANSRLNFQPQNGDQCILRGQVSLYAPRGDYQLIVSTMQPAGAGNLMQQFEELKKKLDAEGLFAQEIKKSIPEQPKHIGVITSESTAALQDILSTIERRAPVSQVSLIPATVQGDSAPRTIISALQSVLNYNNLNNANAFDLILICRGGGSIEDLWAFNNESLAREMFDFPLPIISGVGHEIDFTITDFVADLRAPTPTAAAELATEYFFNLSDKLDETKSSMCYLIERKLNEKKQQISYASQNLKSPTTHLKEQSQSLDNIEIRISSSIKQTLGLALQSLQITKNQFLQSSGLRRFERNEDLLTAKLQTLKYGFENTLKKRRFYLENLETKIQAVSPIAVLDRGYAIVMDEKGKALKSSKQLSAGSKISTRLAKGTFEANVTKTN